MDHPPLGAWSWTPARSKVSWHRKNRAHQHFQKEPSHGDFRPRLSHKKVQFRWNMIKHYESRCKIGMGLSFCVEIWTNQIDQCWCHWTEKLHGLHSCVTWSVLPAALSEALFRRSRPWSNTFIEVGPTSVFQINCLIIMDSDGVRMLPICQEI